MNLKERIVLLINLVAELDDKQKAVKQEISDTIEFVEPEELTQEFIDWLYWETDIPSQPLAKAMGIKTPQLKSKITPIAKISLPCLECGKEIFFNVTGRQNRHELKSDYHKLTGKRKNSYVCNPDRFICSDCKQKALEQEEQKKIKNNIIAAKRRVTLNGQGLDLENMPYGEYLQTEYWKKFAHRARKNADYRCQKCGRGNTLLDVHHLTYERRGKEWYSDVLVLCRHCHSTIHRKVVE